MAEAEPLKDKVILITGAGQGLGAATAKYLAVCRAILSLSDISEATVKATAQSIRDAHPESQAASYVVDVCDSDSVKKWVERTKDQFGRIDGCVNNAGVLPREIVPITELKLDDWHRVLDVNLTGVFVCLKHQMGAIADNVPYLGSYGASKHGVVGLTKAAACEAGARRVRVNAVCPHLMETPMVGQLHERYQGSLAGESATLLKGPMKPEDCAALISFLLFDESRAITKAIYPIDLGYQGY